MNWLIVASAGPHCNNSSYARARRLHFRLRFCASFYSFLPDERDVLPLLLAPAIMLVPVLAADADTYPVHFFNAPQGI